MNKYYKPLSLILVTSIFLAGCQKGKSLSSSIESSEVAIVMNSLREALTYLKDEKNYSYSYIDKDEKSHSIIFNEDKVIFSNQDGKSSISSYIQDDEGVFHLTYEDDYQPGEYLVDDNGDKITDLWSSSYLPSVYKKGESLINGLSDESEVTITDKPYKMAFIQTLGYSSKDYVNVNYLKAKFADGVLTFDLSMVDLETSITVSDYGVAKNQEINDLVKDGIKGATFEDRLLDFRRLMKMNNYIREIYDFETTSYTGYELFNEHYFVSELYKGSAAYGSMEMNQKGDEEHHPGVDLFGCYSFYTDAKMSETTLETIHFYSFPSFERPSIEEYYHYPCYLSLLKNMEFIHAGMIQGMSYIPKGKIYHIYNKALIENFAVNFSIDQTYALDVCVPYALGIDINLKATDQSSIITFLYCFTYKKSKYVMPIPFTSFGHANVELLDSIYEEYND